MSSTIDLNEMLVFTKVIEAGSFTHAAHSLGIPKSTLSRKVKLLEQRLGIQLINRTTRQVRLTELGEVYFQKSQKIIAEIEETELSVTHLQSMPRGTLKIAAPVDLGTALAPLFQEFIHTNDSINIRIHLSEEIVDLIGEDYDLAIRVGPLENSSLIARKIGSIPLKLYASPQYLKKRKLPTQPNDLSEHECLLFLENSERPLWVLNGPEGKKNIRVQGRLNSNNSLLIHSACLLGLGVGMIPTILCHKEVRQKKLIPILPQWYAEDNGIYVVQPPRAHTPPKVRAFLDFLEKNQSKLPWQIG